MRLFFMISILLVGACAPTSQVPDVDNAVAQKEADIQREIVLKDDREYYERAINVADKIKRNNTEMCGKKIAPDYGFSVNALATYPKEYKAAAERLFGMREQPTIYHVRPSAEAAKKLEMGDLILSVNDTKIKSGKSGLSQLSKYVADKKYIDQPMKILIDRRGAQQEISITPKAACAGNMIVVTDNTVNAYADGKNMYVTTGMMDFAKKDEDLALVIGHELAHNTRKHVEAKQGNAFLGMVLGAVVTGVTGVNVMGLGSDLGSIAYSQSFEAEADYVGIYHAARAGYDVSEAPDLWRRMGAKNPKGIHLSGSSHPSTAKRFVALDMAAQEIQDKKAKNQNLTPDEKSKKEYKKVVGEYNE